MSNQWRGDEVERQIMAAAERGLVLAAEHLLGASTAVCPLQEGTLVRSAVASVDRSALKAAVSYDTVYAVRQHEELTWRHDPGRKAKYLEEPAQTEARTMGRIIATQVRRATQ